MKPALTIVIPAKNEEARIKHTLEKYVSFITARAKQLPVEILVVVNNSTDQTAKIATEVSKEHAFVKVIETGYATGKGGAVALGFSQATGNRVGFVDADGAISPQDFFSLAHFLFESPNLDGVVGTRKITGSSTSFTRRFIIRLYNLYVKTFFNINYSDTQCGAKIFRAHQAREIAKRLNSLGWVFDVNFLLVCKYLNYNVVERPVAWQEKEGSKFSLSEAVFHLPLEFFALKRLELSYYSKGLFSFNYHANSKRRKTVLIFMWRDLKHPDHGGSEIYTFNVAKRLTRDFDVLWFTSRPSNLAPKDEIDGVKIFRAGGLFTVYLWAAYYYLVKFRKQVDFVIDTENGMSFFTPLFVNKPVIFIIHHIHGAMWFKEMFPPLSFIGYLLERFFMPPVYRKTPIITVSPSSKGEIKKLGFKETRIFLAYNAVDFGGSVAGTNARSETPLLLYHGRLKAYKRVHLAIKMYAKVLKRFPAARLVVSGAGSDYAKLVALAKRLGLAGKVDFLGFVSDEKKWELMQKAWVFLMPSVVEGWGITVIEAAVCGTPTVGFDVPGVRDSVRHGQTGLLSQTERDFCDNVINLLSDKALREQMGKNCVYWANLFSWDKTTEVIKRVMLASSEKTSLLSNKVYPWNLELHPDFVNTIAQD